MKSLVMPIRQGGDGMSGKSIISNSYLEDIGDAIRYKKDTEDTYYPSQMGDAIRSIEGIVPAGTLEIDANGTYDVTEYAEADVSVPDPVITSLTVTEDGIYEVPSGVDGYDPVTVNTGVDALRSEINSAVEASGCDPLVEGITALTAYANEVTGASDTTLSDAVGTLVAGYTGGSSDLYPIGTDLVGAYLGRNWTNGQGFFVHGTFTSTGEMTQTDVDADFGLCMVYLPIDPSYTYVKSDGGRINGGFYYDENYNFIKSFQSNNLAWTTLDPAPQNAKYLRFATLYLTNNWDVAIYRSA